jgi:hypothetical protein
MQWQFVESNFTNTQASCDELLEQTTKSILNEPEPQMAVCSSDWPRFAQIYSKLLPANHKCGTFKEFH